MSPRQKVEPGSVEGLKRSPRLANALPTDRTWTTDREAMRAALRVALSLPPFRAHQDAYATDVHRWSSERRTRSSRRYGAPRRAASWSAG